MIWKTKIREWRNAHIVLLVAVLSWSLQASIKFPEGETAEGKHDAWFAFPTPLSIISYSHLTADSLQIASPLPQKDGWQANLQFPRCYLQGGNTNQQCSPLCKETHSNFRKVCFWLLLTWKNLHAAAVIGWHFNVGMQSTIRFMLSQKCESNHKYVVVKEGQDQLQLAN